MRNILLHSQIGCGSCFAAPQGALFMRLWRIFSSTRRITERDCLTANTRVNLDKPMAALTSIFTFPRFTLGSGYAGLGHCQQFRTKSAQPAKNWKSRMNPERRSRNHFVRRAALKTHAVQTLCAVAWRSTVVKRLDCVRFIAALGAGVWSPGFSRPGVWRWPLGGLSG